MTDKELKKLNRYQLLELIIMQTEELEKVKSQLAEAQQQLEQRNIQLEKAGNIAQAALQLSGIFEAAQAAADIYLENVKQQYGNTAQQTEKTVQNVTCCHSDVSENVPQVDDTLKFVERIIKECTE